MSILKKSLCSLNQSKKGGEIGEILLHGVMRDYYNALCAVPKIFYKQNKNDYAKGCDSVHSPAK